MIYYFCPDLTVRSAGMRRMYRHVDFLCRHGLPASILHYAVGFRLSDMPRVPVAYFTAPTPLRPDDVVVMPEGYLAALKHLKDVPVRRVVLALSWSYVYKVLDDGVDWRTYRVERVLVNSPYIADFLAWALRLPVHLFTPGINQALYTYRPEEKVAQISYLERKKNHGDELRRALHSRNPAFTTAIAWKGHKDLTEAEYAAEIRKSRVFLSLSGQEGMPVAPLEAMAAGTLVAGYHNVGGQRELVGDGPAQNCILAENLDYPTLARRLEPYLLDLLAGDLGRWEPVLRNGLALSGRYPLEEEERTVVALWREILDR